MNSLFSKNPFLFSSNLTMSPSISGSEQRSPKCLRNSLTSSIAILPSPCLSKALQIICIYVLCCRCIHLNMSVSPAPKSLHDLPCSLEVLRLWVCHLCVVVVHHPDELPDVEPPVVVHVCPRHQLVDLCMGGIVTQGSHQTAKLPNADVATFILDNEL